MHSDGLSNLESLLRTLSTLGIGGLLSWMAGWLWQRRQHQDARTDRRLEREERASEHGSKLILEILAEVRSELSATKIELGQARTVVAAQQRLSVRLDYFDEALTHIEALVRTSDEGELTFARTSGRLFLDRMKRLADREVFA